MRRTAHRAAASARTTTPVSATTSPTYAAGPKSRIQLTSSPKNVSPKAALAFKVAIAQRLAPIGERIEALYPGLTPGEGGELLMNSYAFIIGLWQQADTPLVLRDAMKRPEMAIFRIDFEKQLTAALLDLWESAERRGAQRKS